jgi:hypothetical protein
MNKIIILLILVSTAIAGYFTFSKNQAEDFITNNSQTNQTAQIVQNDSEGEYKTFVFQKVQFYTKYEAKAPIWFDLVLAEIFNFTELKYQIENSKRRSPDTTGQIDGRGFKKYDLIDDFGFYGGDSAGQVKIFVGPKIRIDGQDYYLVFHWEERPLAEYMPYALDP